MKGDMWYSNVQNYTKYKYKSVIEQIGVSSH